MSGIQILSLILARYRWFTDWEDTSRAVGKGTELNRVGDVKVYLLRAKEFQSQALHFQGFWQPGLYTLSKKLMISLWGY